MEQLMTNMKKVEKRGYIVDGFVQSITRVFDVPKGEVNVQVVYDATKCGPNKAVWSPVFLPTHVVQMLLQSVKTLT